MWVLTEGGAMVNLAQCVAVDIDVHSRLDGEPMVDVVALEPINRPIPDTDGPYELYVLCTIPGDESHGYKVIKYLFDALRVEPFVKMADVVRRLRTVLRTMCDPDYGSGGTPAFSSSSAVIPQ